MMETVAGTGAGMSGASAMHMNVFGLHPVVVHGTDEQKRRWLPPIIKGEAKACFGVTEPNTGLNTLKLKTMAVRKGDRYVVNGQKVWISTAQVAQKILLLARTTPIEQVTSPGMGLSLFYTDLDRSRIQVHEIEKLGRKAVDSNALFIDNLEIPVEDRIGEEGQRLQLHPHGMNPGARAAGRRGDRPRQGGVAARRALRRRAHRLRPADRQEPGRPASAGRALGGPGSRHAALPARCMAVRPGQAVRRRGQRRQVLLRGSRISRLPRPRC